MWARNGENDGNYEESKKMHLMHITYGYACAGPYKKTEEEEEEEERGGGEGGERNVHAQLQCANQTDLMSTAVSRSRKVNREEQEEEKEEEKKRGKEPTLVARV